MPGDSKIEWTDRTWNPMKGCTKVSAGCANCYAERLAPRIYKDGFTPRFIEDRILVPQHWRKPALIFVNSMSDLFHEAFNDDMIMTVFSSMKHADRHIFQILTKRPERMINLVNTIFAPAGFWPLKNVWLGVSAENQATYNQRVPLLSNIVEKTVNFISMEPLLELVDVPAVDLSRIDWIIAGGESGPGARPVKTQWFREIRDSCEAARIPFFFKQYGGSGKDKGGHLLDHLEYQEFPREVDTWRKKGQLF